METNPASELHDLCTQLKNSGRDDRQTRDVLAEIFRCQSSNDPLFLELLAIIAKRFANLIQLIDRSSELPTDLRDTSRTAVEHLALITSTDSLTSRWGERRKAVLSNEHIIALRFIGGSFQKEFPLRILSKEQRSELIDTINRAIPDLLVEQPQTFVHDATINVLQSIKIILEHFEFFGTEALSDKLLWAHSNLNATKSRALGAGIANAAKVVSIGFGVVASIVGVLAIVPKAEKGTEILYGYSQNAIEYLSKELPKDIPKLTDQRSEMAQPENARLSPSSKSLTQFTEPIPGVNEGDVE